MIYSIVSLCGTVLGQILQLKKKKITCFLIVITTGPNLSPLCWQDSAWWRATRMNQRREALTTFVWPPLLQVTGQAATATSVSSISAFSYSKWALKKSLDHQKHQVFPHKETTKWVPTKFRIKERVNEDVILCYFDGTDGWICRWVYKVFD